MQLKENKGQATVESIGALCVLLFVIPILIGAAYLGWAKNWMNYQTHEAVVCCFERQLYLICQSKLKEKTNQGLPFGTAINAKVRCSRNLESRASIAWEWTFLGITARLDSQHKASLKQRPITRRLSNEK